MQKLDAGPMRAEMAKRGRKGWLDTEIWPMGCQFDAASNHEAEGFGLRTRRPHTYIRCEWYSKLAYCGNWR